MSVFYMNFAEISDAIRGYENLIEKLESCNNTLVATTSVVDVDIFAGADADLLRESWGIQSSDDIPYAIEKITSIKDALVEARTEFKECKKYCINFANAFDISTYMVHPTGMNGILKCDYDDASSSIGYCNNIIDECVDISDNLDGVKRKFSGFHGSYDDIYTMIDKFKTDSEKVCDVISTHKSDIDNYARMVSAADDNLTNKLRDIMGDELENIIVQDYNIDVEGIYVINPYDVDIDWTSPTGTMHKQIIELMKEKRKYEDWLTENPGATLVDYYYQQIERINAEIRVLKTELLFMESYGFTEEQSELLCMVIDGLGRSSLSDKNSPEYIHYIFGTLSTLCISYDATRWRMTTGQPTLWQAKNRLYFIGLDDQQILDLRVLINLQHGDYSYNTLKNAGIDIENSSYFGESHATFVERSIDRNNDFSHQVVQIAAFSCGDIMYNGEGYFPGRHIVDLINSNDFEYSYTNYEISFKGDIDSNRYDETDFQSDVDAINIYNRMINCCTNEVYDIWSDYYYDIYSGNGNRANELFEYLGDGEAEIGILELSDILEKNTIGSNYIQDEKDNTMGKQIFVQWLMCEYEGIEYVFPEKGN